MKRKRHRPEQIIRKLSEADQLLSENEDTAVVCQTLEIAEATFHRWRNQYGSNEGDRAGSLTASTSRSNSRFRDRLLNSELFTSSQEAKIVTEDFRLDYNHHRPHSSLGYETPAVFAARCRNKTLGGAAPYVYSSFLPMPARAGKPPVAPKQYQYPAPFDPSF